MQVGICYCTVKYVVVALIAQYDTYFPNYFQSRAMSVRPGSSERTPISTSSPSNSKGVAATPAGGVPPKPDTIPPHGLPSATIPRLPLVTTSGAPQLLQAQSATIPPLMGIQPNIPPPLPRARVSSNSSQAIPPLAPHPIPNLAAPVNSTAMVPPTGPPGASSSRFPVVGGKGPKPNVNSGELRQRSTEVGGKQMKGKEDGDNRYVN